MARWKNQSWDMAADDHPTYDMAQLATLMDIRDELQTLNAVFRCHNALVIPELLRAIKKNTTKPRRKKSA